MFNRALLKKWLWHHHNEREAFWKDVIDSKYGGSWGQWCSMEVQGFMVLNGGKTLEDGVFYRHTRFMVGDGSRIRFWHDIWHGDRALKDTFLIVYRIACRQEASVAEVMEISGGSLQWNVNFIKAAHDWEVGFLADFFSLLYFMG